MRHIDRLPSPKILTEKHSEWQQKYDEKLKTNPKARPDSTKYAHKDIRRQLMTMSYGKCFYCESRLSNRTKEVDHFIEVAVDRSKAYAWENLYLSCQNCNDKIPHDVISVDEALDPCRDSDETIKANISFDNEMIVAVPGSPLGLNTIKKFRLNDEQLDNRRAKWLIRIERELRMILINMLDEGRNKLNENERLIIESFKQPNQPYSLMSEIYIDGISALKRYL